MSEQLIYCTNSICALKGWAEWGENPHNDALCLPYNNSWGKYFIGRMLTGRRICLIIAALLLPLNPLYPTSLKFMAMQTTVTSPTTHWEV